MNVHTIQLTNDELLIIQEALFAMPFGKVAPLINNLNKQLEPKNDTAGTE